MIWVYMFVIAGSLFFSLQLLTRFGRTADELGHRIQQTEESQISVSGEIELTSEALQAARQLGQELDNTVLTLEKTSSELQTKIDTWTQRNERMGKIKVKHS